MADHLLDESLPHIICSVVPITLPSVVRLASRGIVSAMDLDNATLHHVIMTDIMERGYAPTPEELVERSIAGARSTTRQRVTFAL